MQLKKYLLLTFLLIVNFFHKTLACTCAPPPSFCESITDDEGEFYADLVLRATIKML